MKTKRLLLATTAVIALVANTMAQTLPSYVPTNGLVGWWPFNGNANDESGNGNNGTVNGATLTTDRFGIANKAYSFDGVNDFISVPNSASLSSPVNSITISLWFNINNWDFSLPPTGYASLLCKSTNTSQTQYRLALSTLWLSMIFAGQDNQWYYPTNTIQTNTLNHIIIVASNSSISIYLNNVLFGPISNQNAYPLNNNMNLEIGRDQLTAPDYFNGVIDDIGIWNRALTQQEITDLYNGCQLTVNSHPTSQTININNIAQFVVSSSDPNATYQWQTDLGVGFQNLNSVGQYSGTTITTLTVSNVTMSNNNQPFRCIISSGSCSDTSSVAVLTVNNNVGINESTNDNLFSVFPNPAQSIINVKTDISLVGKSYSILDITGRIIQTGIIATENTEINLNSLSEGTYVLKINEKLNQSFRIIKN